MVLPGALLVLFGIIDVGMYAWTLNEYEKATQMGARYAVVTEALTPALRNQSYVGVVCNGTALQAGDRICREALGLITCQSTGCACSTTAGACPTASVAPTSTARFDALLARMRQFQPRIPATALRVEYRGSGIGFAGDPNKPEIAPIVTVRVVNAQYSPIVLSPFGGSVPLPDFSYSLSLEDGEGDAAS